MAENTQAPDPEDYVPPSELQLRRIKGTTARSPYLCGRDPADVFVDHVVHEYPEAC